MAAQAMVLAIAPLGGAMAAMVAERLITGTSWRPAMRDALGLAVVATAVSFWASTVIDGGLLVLSAALGLVLILLAEIDRRTMLLPDVITYPLIAAGLATTWVLMPERMAAHIIGAIAGFAAFAIIARAYKMLRGRDGLGLGDAKLMAAAGLGWAGWRCPAWSSWAPSRRWFSPFPRAFRAARSMPARQFRSGRFSASAYGSVGCMGRSHLRGR